MWTVTWSRDSRFQSCSRAVHMDQLLRKLGYLEFSASNMVYGPMQWGPMRTLARKVYELYTRNELKEPDLVNFCQELKTLQWQIDERWTEVNHHKSES